MTVPDHSAPPRPQSDVSSAVGLVGALGLCLWILFCHFYPEVAPALGLDPARGRLTGPNAALAGLLASAGPMVLWSVLVDKVHLRPSTGIDWSLKRPLGDVMDISITKLAGLWATWTIIGCLYFLGRWYWNDFYAISMQVLANVMVPVFFLSVPYVLWLDRNLVEPKDASWHFGAMLVGREAYDPEKVRIHLRAWAVKGFFTAFMIAIVPAGFADLVGRDWSEFVHQPAMLAGLLITMMFVFDEQIGTVGYILTMKPLDAQIRSANPHLAGWVAALMCYPPFQVMQGGGPIEYQINTRDWAYWLDGYPALMWLWAAMLVLLTAIYAWATVIFGIRFSNLTYRGVISNGPYAYTRHPAYLSKNAFWWLATLPFLVTSHSATDAVRNTFFLGCVSAIYYWRARTEEKHLLGEDAKYRDYHAWMQHHGAITSRLVRLGQMFRRRV
ncbi:methyltransferase family protein [Novosphingobium sp. B 225]|uniref:methyltransferase family protein n=1 Tax=Novosphingobium sp. B 225 TaxID=1961849 RepID=UPI000B4AB53D|nr:isoprenylcysteine carboxylmethyltransferase family protein [Novosphingobium sp. B 225]